MSMSKKDYVAIANVLRSNGTTARDTSSTEGQRWVASVMTDLADLFAAENPQFDKDRFFVASLPVRKPRPTGLKRNVMGMADVLCLTEIDSVQKGIADTLYRALDSLNHPEGLEVTRTISPTYDAR